MPSNSPQPIPSIFPRALSATTSVRQRTALTENAAPSATAHRDVARITARRFRLGAEFVFALGCSAMGTRLPFGCHYDRTMTNPGGRPSQECDARGTAAANV